VAVAVSGASLAIPPAGAPLGRRPLVWILASLVAATAAWFGIRKSARARKKARLDGHAAPNAALESPLDAEIASLRARCDGADARAWTADAERLCKSFLCGRLGISRPDNVRFEAALDQYLSRGRDLGPEAAAAWSALRDLFHEARYAGARREPHVLLAACSHLKTCLRPNEGIEHGQPVSA
jgi:hypothetical protein